MATDVEPIDTGPEAARGRAARPLPLPGVRRALGWLVLAGALALTFSLYLRPGLVLDLGMVLEMCGLR